MTVSKHIWQNQKCVIESMVITAVGVMLILLSIFVIEELAPFGNNSLASMDARIQYLDFFAYLKDVLDGKNSVRYSFSNALGGTYIGLFSYYLSSPFNFLVVLFNKEDLNIFFDILVVLKLMLCGATCAFFLASRFKKLSEFFVVLLSISYALMQYNIAQSSNIMWLDGVYMLPIILLGVHHLVENESGLWLSLSVGLAIIFNWYSAGIDCLFSVIWCAVELIGKYDCRQEIKEVVRVVGKYIVHMLLGVGLSAVLFLPTVFALREGKGTFEWNNLRTGFIGNPLSLIQNLTIGATSQKGSVSLFCGCFVVLGAFAYFLKPTNNKKQKRTNGLLALITIMIFYFMPLVFLFSLLKSVYSYWYRYSYVGVFILIYFAAFFYSEWQDEENGEKYIALSCWGIIGFLLFLDYANSKWEIDQTFLTIFFYIVVAMILCLYLKCEDIKQKGCAIALSVIVFGDLCSNAHILINTFQVKDVDIYHEYVKEQSELVESVKQYDDGIYRISQNATRNMKSNCLTANYNEAAAFDYSSLSNYSSAAEQKQLDFLELLGYRKNGNMMNIVNTSILPADSLLGVKYFLGTDRISGLELVKDIPSKNGKKVYYNPFCLPNAFVFSGNNNTVDVENPFVYQNSLYSKLLGYKVDLFKAASFAWKDEGNQRICDVEMPSGNIALYGNIKSKKDLNADLYINQKYHTAYSQWLAPSVFYIPEGGGDQTGVEVVLQTDENLDLVQDMQFYYLDLDYFKTIVEKIAIRKINTINIQEGYVQGTVKGKQGELLCLTIPYHKQWTILRNGEETEAEDWGGYLICIPLVDGDNKIEMTYHVRGMLGGCLISCIAFCLLLCVAYVEKKRGLINKDL